MHGDNGPLLTDFLYRIYRNEHSKPAGGRIEIWAFDSRFINRRGRDRWKRRYVVGLGVCVQRKQCRVRHYQRLEGGCWYVRAEFGRRVG